MPKHPTLEIARLILRQFTLDDAPLAQAFLNDQDVADTNPLMRYPYELRFAEESIKAHREAAERGKALYYAVTLRATGEFMGSVLLTIDNVDARGEFGYWIGKPYWSHGYCTEAVIAVMKHAFEVLKLGRIQAYHYAGNPASGRVLQKAGMRHERSFQQYSPRLQRYMDYELYGISKSEYFASLA